MRLARKLMIALSLGIVVVMAIFAYVEIRREVVIFEADIERNEKFGLGVGAAFEEIWAMEGEARARHVLHTTDVAGPTETSLRWVWLDPPSGAPPRAPRETIATSKRAVVLTEQDQSGEWWRYTYIPMIGPDGGKAAIEWTESLRKEMTYLRTNRIAMVLVTVLISTVCGLIAMSIVYWFVGRPVRLLRDRARAVGAGDFSGRLALRQQDEIGELAGEIDAMSERLLAARDLLTTETEARIAALEQMRHTDRLATVGKLASGVAHELGTPLNVIGTRAKMILDGRTGEGDATQHARIIGEQAERVTAIIRQLLDFSRRRSSKPSTTNLTQLIKRTLNLLSPVAKKAGVTVVYEAADGAMPVHVDQNQLQQALTNVIINGIQAMPQGGRLLIDVRPVSARSPLDHGGSPGEYFRVLVEDEGHGISPEHLPHVFEPFFTTKGIGEGTGLGLSVAHGIVAEHGGWIEVESTLPQGTRFSIFLLPAAGLVTDTVEVAS
jgi:signal transduction histidine kinase